MAILYEWLTRATLRSMVVVTAGCHLSSLGRQAGWSETAPAERIEDETMTDTNVIEFAPVLQRRREQQIAHAIHASRSTPWRGRYRDGIDGLVSIRRMRALPGEVVPFVAAESRPHANAD
jgi:hypothetical protein